MYQYYNPNPVGARVGDCAVRAVACALDMSWEQAYIELCTTGYLMGDLPNSNNVWGSVLRKRGFHRRVVPDTCPECYTLREFCRDHPHGTFVVAFPGHVCCVHSGDHYDAFDSGAESPTFYWTNEEE